MNNVSMSGARPFLAAQFEVVRPKKTLPIEESPKSDESETEFSDETESGLLRLAKFMKITHKTGDHKRDRRRLKGYEAYETIANFDDRIELGQLLNLRV
jgi:hypothetical protein